MFTYLRFACVCRVGQIGGRDELQTRHTRSVPLCIVEARSEVGMNCKHGAQEGRSDIRGIGRLQMRLKLSAQEAMRGLKNCPD